jgi:N,N'-diacetylchitobiose transport system substrate-binding protein
MRLRLLVAALVAAPLALVAATAGTAGTASAKASTLTVWLQVDAQSGWPDVVAAANKQFEAKHPGMKVDIQYQQWTTHLQKFDSTLAGGNSPDVIEMGNTEMTKYLAAGAFANLTSDKSSFPNSRSWLTGLTKSASYGGKLFGVPYYAGSRVVVYRTDQYKKAGIRSAPKSLTQFVADGKKLMKTYGKKDKTYSAFYVAGKDWYSGLAFVYDYGGTIAKTKGGKWIGTLNSPKAIAGLNAFKTTYLALSRASKSTDEAHPFPTVPFSQGHAGSFVGPGWQFGYALDPKAGNPALKPVLGAFPMPSHLKGRYMPAFLGGSDLAIPSTSGNKSAAEDWISAFTDNASMAGIVKAGNIPNSTSLLNLVTGTPGAALAQAAKFTWFVPTAKNWTNVENANVLRNMLTSILTGKQSVKAAATSASNQITQILNAES